MNWRIAEVVNGGATRPPWTYLLKWIRTAIDQPVRVTLQISVMPTGLSLIISPPDLKAGLLPKSVGPFSIDVPRWLRHALLLFPNIDTLSQF